MKSTLIILGILGLGIYGPCLLEGTTNTCSALERRGFAILQPEDKKTEKESEDGAVLGKAFATLLQRASDGAFVEAMERKAYPSVPPTIGCTIAYWRSFGPNTGNVWN